MNNITHELTNSNIGIGTVIRLSRIIELNMKPRAVRTIVINGIRIITGERNNVKITTISQREPVNLTIIQKQIIKIKPNNCVKKISCAFFSNDSL
jgi:hypothetical protein